MLNHYYIYFLVFFVIIAVLLLLIGRRKKSVPEELFIQARRNENLGDLEGAVSNYESALKEIQKARNNASLRIKIIDKLRMLHTVIEYEKGVRFVRQSTGKQDIVL